ncbi:glutamate synthase subunit beta [candidate division KSB1 bacterium]|nr:glutamate synthase subunit beta [candidate division KSB1 bacterium]
MGKSTGFLVYPRAKMQKRPVQERVRDFFEFEAPLTDGELIRQAARCMDCGVPHCHTFGCPLHNLMPEWNDWVYRGRFREALQVLHATNNFPEFTGRICPAPCEAACTLALEEQAVTIRHIEWRMVEIGWEQGWIQPHKPAVRSGKRVAVIGSGPAGLAAAQQLARHGHEVVVYERMVRIGGILRYGIPDFKLEKWVIDRRLEQMRSEGVVFEPGVEAGVDLSFSYLRSHFDALLLASGATAPRELEIPGRDLDGIFPAMSYLTHVNSAVAGERIDGSFIDARDRRVVVIGGGDTGSDCVGTARRQGAASIVQIEILPEPPSKRAQDNPWPTWPHILRTSSSHEEGCRRLWGLETTAFIGQNGRVTAIEAVSVDAAGGKKKKIKILADLVFLALGFSGTETDSLFEQTQWAVDERGFISVDSHGHSSRNGLFAAGDCVSGPSLVVRAIARGRQTAAGIDRFLGSGR